MTGFYDDLDAIMQECLADFDCRTQKLQLVGKSSKQMNPITREFEFTEAVPVEITAITLPVNKSVIDGESIFVGDIRVIMDKKQQPQKDDNIIIDGENYAFVQIDTFNAGGVLLGFDCVVRR
jgi:hypothetical protein